MTDEFSERTRRRKIPCIVYSRIVGYFSPVKVGETFHWNVGKAQEWKDRRMFDPGKAIDRLGETEEADGFVSV